MTMSCKNLDLKKKHKSRIRTFIELKCIMHTTNLVTHDHTGTGSKYAELVDVFFIRSPMFRSPYHSHSSSSGLLVACNIFLTPALLKFL